MISTLDGIVRTKRPTTDAHIRWNLPSLPHIEDELLACTVLGSSRWLVCSLDLVGKSESEC